MKKFLWLIACAVTLVLASCGTEDCDHEIGGGGSSSGGTTAEVKGSWYEEALNEEMRYNADGTFYDKFSLPTRANEATGRWEYNSSTHKLTTTYKFMGVTQYGDWTVKTLNDYVLVISSAKEGDHTLGRIAETYNMKVGDTQSLGGLSLLSGCVVKSYESKNPGLASVDAAGTVKAEGEKGTTYIKIATDKGNLWAKVVVGDDIADLWYSYQMLMGADYATLTNVMGQPATSGDDGYSYAFDVSDLHDYLDDVYVWMDKTTGFVNHIALQLKSAAPESQVLSYIKNHYYEFSAFGNTTYTTGTDFKSSKATVGYVSDTRMVHFTLGKNFGWTDYDYMFGKTQDEVIAAMGEPLLVYSNRVLYMFGAGKIAVSMFFSLDANTGKVTAYQYNLNENGSADDYKKVLASKYHFSKYFEEQNAYRYYDNEDAGKATRMVIYSVDGKYIIVYDLEHFGK